MTASWQNWLAERRAASTMHVLPKPLDKLGGGWGMFPEAFRREDNRFFSLRGFEVRGGSREVPGWGQPMQVQHGEGVIILAYEITTGRYLLRALTEPGNPATYERDWTHAPHSKRHLLLAPTLQTSRDNLAKAHGGNGPPRTELWTNPPARVLWSNQPQDGGRFYGKVNKLGVLVVEMTSITSLATLDENERWFTEQELFLAIRAEEVNEFVLQCYSLHKAACSLD